MNKMKLAICSDLHLEFGDLYLQNDENADVLVLGGDILLASDLVELDTPSSSNSAHERRLGRAKRYVDFIERCCLKFKLVLYVAGNHEHYHGDFAESFSILRKYFGHLTNFIILDKEGIKIGDTVFFGGTLWTDMNKEDPSTLLSISGMMNDFRIVQNSNRMVSYRVYPENNNPNSFHMKERPGVFKPEDAVEDHKEFIRRLDTWIKLYPTDKFVVVGHHAPSKQSTHPRYAGEQLMNGGYSSDLNQFIMDNPQIKLWSHGHTHEPFDYMIGSCRIVCNPRGYIGREIGADNFVLKYVEI